MRKKTGNIDFIRFLKDERFIEWKLFPTDELNSYWNDFLHQYPDKRKDFELAEKHFRNINISSHEMAREKKHEAIKRLDQSLRTYTRKRNLRRFTYAAAACAALLVISILYTQRGSDRSGEDLVATRNYIVGNELESEDILFITGNKTASFQSDVDIQIDGDRIAQVRSEYEETEEISIEQHTMNRLIVPYGKRSRITLADGTQVWLNSGSTLEFPSAFTENTRKVRLSGEMYIEVAPDKNKSFYVHTNNFNLKVYGTKFNVSSYSGSASSVVLVEGSVSLQSTGMRELFLSPNELAIYSEGNGDFHTRTVDVMPFISWKDGYLTFNDTPMTEVVRQIERYYNLSFNFDDSITFQGLTCTGKIILSDNLDNMMTALSLISETEFKREDKLIYIYTKENN